MPVEVTTYRYVRGALLALLLALVVAVAVETARHGWRTSVSGYAGTAAGPVFVGALTAIGVCLVALRGYTDAEDVFLDLSGISAPMVAFVPAPEAGLHDTDAVVTSAVAFFVVLAAGYVVVIAAGLRARRPGWPSSWGGFGLVATALAWVVGVVWLAADRDGFVRYGHLLAAVFTFGCVAVVVVLNTDWGVRRLAGVPTSRTRFDTAYWAIVAIMLVTTVAWLVLDYVVDVAWRYALLAEEVVLLGCFAVFWVLQTVDLADPERDLARAPR